MSGLLSCLRAYGFRDAGVFLDWASVFQRDPSLFDANETPDGVPEQREQPSSSRCARVSGTSAVWTTSSRSADETTAFKTALGQTMDLGGHAGTTVVLLTELPDELPAGTDCARTYEQGWTTFERCSAELGKKAFPWKLVIDTLRAARCDRRLPTTPVMMVGLLKTRQFTIGADCDAVLALYDKTANAILTASRSSTLKVCNWMTMTSGATRSGWRRRSASATGWSAWLGAGMTDEYLETLETDSLPAPCGG